MTMYGVKNVSKTMHPKTLKEIIAYAARLNDYRNYSIITDNQKKNESENYSTSVLFTSIIA